jgi:hypothetical protein
MIIRNLFVRVLLVGFLFFPTLAQYIHFSGHHDHPACESSRLHLHEGDTSCELLDYVSNVHAVLPLFSFLTYAQPTVLETILHTTKAYSKALYAKRLRAPPVF